MGAAGGRSLCGCREQAEGKGRGYPGHAVTGLHEGVSIPIRAMFITPLRRNCAGYIASLAKELTLLQDTVCKTAPWR
jgi:hypothetical protein